MGNVLSAAVPSLIKPIEGYLADLNDLHLVQRNEGYTVVKVFVLHDPSFSLKPYCDQIESIRLSLLSSTNCSPFQKVVITEKAAILLREYGKDTLYDRLSTRPFLLDIEKRWIAFQLLKALEQCYNARVCHGDIKSQNVIITGWNWVLLTDFASFKPAFLPYDNPSDFTYFFDTSRRRTCYLAPERFLSTKEVATASGAAGHADPLVSVPEEHCTASQLTHAMDIFSLGCVIAELFMDGTPCFNFAQLLSYRQKSEWKSDILPADISSDLKEMISEMLIRDPNKRPTAPKILSRYKGTVFPDVFYSFLYPYMEGFARHPLLFSDEKVQKLKADAEALFGVLSREENGSKTKVLYRAGIIAVSLTCSVVRSLKFTSSKLDVLNLLTQWGCLSDSDVILNRILPYSLYLFNDSYSRVRAEAIHTCTYLLSIVKKLPREDSRIFVNYILPRLHGVVNDSSSLVRMSLASNIAQLAETAGWYVNQIDGPEVDKSKLEIIRQNFLRMELKELQESVQEIVVTLLCDLDNNIRRTLVQSGLPKLCAFFGKQKASDVLLSHMITFLNDKTDWQLRATFYECCPAAAANIGWQSTLILKPLLQQGLRDFEEMVVFRTLSCLGVLTRLGLVQKPAVYELLQDSVPFLAHPNECLRISAVSFLSGVSKALNMADIHCKVMPLVAPYLKQPLIKLDNEAVLLRCLCDPLPRSVWDLVTKSPLMLDLMDFLRDKNLLRQLSPTQGLFAFDSQETTTLAALAGYGGGDGVAGSGMLPENLQLKQFYQKLRNQGRSLNCMTHLVKFMDM